MSAGENSSPLYMEKPQKRKVNTAGKISAEKQASEMEHIR